MTDTAWGVLSNRAVTAAGVFYFLAFLATLVEWSALRKVPVVGASAAGGASAAVDSAAATATQSAGGGVGAATLTQARPQDQNSTEASGEISDRVAMMGRLGFLLTLLGLGAHGLALLGRGMAADPHRVPWGNMYEFTLSGTFFVTLTYCVTRTRMKLSFLAPVVLGFVLSTLMAAVIWLYAPVAPLTEALNSPWLVIHVVSAVIATGAFTIGGMTSVLYLLKERYGNGRGYLGRLPDLRSLDLISYRMHAFGFPVWTFAVLITGPIWAHQAWSRYWNWDPKEVWAFITWVVYAAYLHARATAGWKGRAAAYVALVGMATLWFNFIGVNFFASNSMHSYAAPAPRAAVAVASGPSSVDLSAD